ncbi:hypothetical protein Gotur_022962 [Gossypium turneri]
MEKVLLANTMGNKTWKPPSRLQLGVDMGFKEVEVEGYARSGEQWNLSHGVPNFTRIAVERDHQRNSSTRDRMGTQESQRNQGM